MLMWASGPLYWRLPSVQISAGYAHSQQGTSLAEAVACDSSGTLQLSAGLLKDKDPKLHQDFSRAIVELLEETLYPTGRGPWDPVIPCVDDSS